MGILTEIAVGAVVVGAFVILGLALGAAMAKVISDALCK